MAHRRSKKARFAEGFARGAMQPMQYKLMGQVMQDMFGAGSAGGGDQKERLKANCVVNGGIWNTVTDSCDMKVPGVERKALPGEAVDAAQGYQVPHGQVGQRGPTIA